MAGGRPAAGGIRRAAELGFGIAWSPSTAGRSITLVVSSSGLESNGVSRGTAVGVDPRGETSDAAAGDFGASAAVFEAAAGELGRGAAVLEAGARASAVGVGALEAGASGLVLDGARVPMGRMTGGFPAPMGRSCGRFGWAGGSGAGRDGGGRPDPEAPPPFFVVIGR